MLHHIGNRNWASSGLDFDGTDLVRLLRTGAPDLLGRLLSSPADAAELRGILGQRHCLSLELISGITLDSATRKQRWKPDPASTVSIDVARIAWTPGELLNRKGRAADDNNEDRTVAARNDRAERSILKRATGRHPAEDPDHPSAFNLIDEGACFTIANPAAIYRLLGVCGRVLRHYPALPNIPLERQLDCVMFKRTASPLAQGTFFGSLYGLLHDMAVADTVLTLPKFKLRERVPTGESNLMRDAFLAPGLSFDTGVILPAHRISRTAAEMAAATRGVTALEGVTPEDTVVIRDPTGALRAWVGPVNAADTHPVVPRHVTQEAYEILRAVSTALELIELCLPLYHAYAAAAIKMHSTAAGTRSVAPEPHKPWGFVADDDDGVRKTAIKPKRNTPGLYVQNVAMDTRATRADRQTAAGIRIGYHHGVPLHFQRSAQPPQGTTAADWLAWYEMSRRCLARHRQSAARLVIDWYSLAQQYGPHGGLTAYMLCAQPELTIRAAWQYYMQAGLTPRDLHQACDELWKLNLTITSVRSPIPYRLAVGGWAALAREKTVTN